MPVLQKICFFILSALFTTKAHSFTCQDLHQSDDFRHPRNSALRYNSAITVSTTSFIIQNIGTVAAILSGNLALLAVALPGTIYSIYNLIDFSFDIRRYNSSKKNDQMVDQLITQSRDLLNPDSSSKNYHEFANFCQKEIIAPAQEEEQNIRNCNREASGLTLEYVAHKLLAMNDVRDSNLCIVVFAEGTPYSLYHKTDFIAKYIRKLFQEESSEVRPALP